MVQLLVLGGLAIVVLLFIGFVFKIMNLVVLVGSWILAGYIAGQVVRGKGYGPIGDAALGLTGGLVGIIVLSLVGLGGIGGLWLVGKIIAGAIGAVILIYAVRFLGGKKDFAK